MDYKDVKPLEDFDWSAIDSKDTPKNQAEIEQQSEAYERTFNQFTEQEVIEGTIVSINDREAVVNIGFKSDGVIPASELRYNPDFKAGDKIEVYVESQEEANGQLLLSHKKARILKRWERVNQAYESEEIIT
ncbi:MAG: S1 RNA-binding domain-containing protein, partial [Bacteroidales bacterium]|nr:S1 RNA-binding domain-containing protein [Bacteroidales bacterium]